MTVNNISEIELKLYFKDVTDKLICDRKQKKYFIECLKNDVKDFLAQTPDATLKQVEAVFGTPEVIAQSFMENSDSTEIKRKLDIKKIITAAIIIALLIYLVFVIISLIDVHTEAHGYFEEGILMFNSILKGETVL